MRSQNEMYSRCPRCHKGNVHTYRHPKAKVWCEHCGFVIRDEGGDEWNPVPDVEYSPLVDRIELIKDLLTPLCDPARSAPGAHLDIAKALSLLKSVVNDDLLPVKVEEPYPEQEMNLGNMATLQFAVVASTQATTGTDMRNVMKYAKEMSRVLMDTIREDDQ